MALSIALKTNRTKRCCFASNGYLETIIRTNFCLFLMICYALFPVGLASNTLTQGEVSGIWNINKSPYIVENDIIIPNDSVLIIQAGVEVRFNGHFKLTINGRLIASGTADSMILFTRHYPLEKYNWWGLRFIDADTGCKIENCIIEYGQTDYPDLCGGGIYCLRSSPTIAHCIIQKNHSYQHGGGIYCEGSSPFIDGNNILNNSSGLSGDFFSSIEGSGGGIYLKDSSPVITNNIILRNKSGFIGGFAGDGGGIYIKGTSSPTIVNNLIRENNSIEGAGGGVYCLGTQTLFYNNIFHNNSALGFIGFGGGIWADSSTIIKNCIFWENSWILSDIDTEFVSEIEGNPNITFSNIRGGFPGDGNIDQDPLYVNASKGDFHLSSGSPCIDTGDPDPEFNDLDGTRNDMGIYGGPAAVIITTEGVNTTRSMILDQNCHLAQNFPNPFNLSTVLTYWIPYPARVRLEIFNCLGEKVAVLMDEIQPEGNHAVPWNSSGFTSGAYYFVLRFDGRVLTKQCILLK
jgi:hypothetical protein